MSDLEKEPSVTEKTIEIPDGGYGWVITFAFFLYNFCTWGANAGYAVYLATYLSRDVFPGGGKLDYAAIGGLAFGVGLLFAPVIIYFSRNYGVHVVIGLGIFCQCAALLLAAFSKKLWQIYLTQGLLISFGLALICIPSMGLIPQWFRKRRTLAAGIGAGGSGLGGIIFNLGMQKIIEVKSVKWALIVQCIICTSLGTLALILTKTRNQHIHGSAEQTQPLGAAFKEHIGVFKVVGMWALCSWVSFTMLGYVILLYSLSAFTQSLGYDPKEGSYVSCMISVGSLIGRPLIGHMADRYGPITVGALVNLVVAILCWAMWIPCRSLSVAIVFALLQGGLMGTVWVIFGSATARVVGLKKIDKAFSVMWFFIALFGIPAPVIGLQLRSNVANSKTNYEKTAIFTGFAFLGAALSLLCLRAYILSRDKVASIHAKGEDSMDHDETHYKVTLPSFFKGLISKNTSNRTI
ncbi:hypothetical protein KDRO_D04280 [Kluyveromyces lactis]|nr:hypothetical protein KDRO_D04280 [Kluyveromyces lactis]